VRIRFVACNRVGSRLRTFWPAEALAARGWDAEASQRWPKPGQADLVIRHRPTDLDDVAAVQAHRDAGAVVLIDEDDELSALPPEHGWQPNPVCLLRHDQCIEVSDGLTVSTQRLKTVYGPLAPRCWMIPNALPARVAGYGGEPLRDGKVRIGWAGIVKTHRHDLHWLAPAAGAMIQGAVFTTIGDHRTWETLGLRGRIDKIFGFAFDEAEYYRGMSRADIGLVPLLPCDFNRSKSALKALEYATLGKPVVATDLPEQRRVVRDGETGFLVRTPEDFAAAVQELVHNVRLRERMGKAAHEHAATMTLELRIGAWEKVLRSVAKSALAEVG